MKCDAMTGRRQTLVRRLRLLRLARLLRLKRVRVFLERTRDALQINPNFLRCAPAPRSCAVFVLLAMRVAVLSLAVVRSLVCRPGACEVCRPGACAALTRQEVESRVLRWKGGLQAVQIFASRPDLYTLQCLFILPYWRVLCRRDEPKGDGHPLCIPRHCLCSR